MTPSSLFSSWTLGARSLFCCLHRLTAYGMHGRPECFDPSSSYRLQCTTARASTPHTSLPLSLRVFVNDTWWADHGVFEHGLVAPSARRFISTGGGGHVGRRNNLHAWAWHDQKYPRILKGLGFQWLLLPKMHTYFTILQDINTFFAREPDVHPTRYHTHAIQCLRHVCTLRKTCLRRQTTIHDGQIN